MRRPDTEIVMSNSEAERLLPEGELLWVNEWEAALTLLIGGVGILVGLVALFAGSGRYHHVPAWLTPVVGLLCVGVGTHIGMKSRSGLIVDEDGISVQSAIRRRRWRWHEVESFELTMAIYVPVLRISLADGGHVRTPGFKGRSKNERDLAKERVAELNRRVAAARSI
jgi:PH (Pleckstrin Homology) domain-containing protein